MSIERRVSDRFRRLFLARHPPSERAAETVTQASIDDVLADTFIELARETRARIKRLDRFHARRH